MRSRLDGVLFDLGAAHFMIGWFLSFGLRSSFLLLSLQQEINSPTCLSFIIEVSSHLAGSER